MESGFADLGGSDFYYELAGEGPALVLLHAGIADRRMWDGQFGALAEHYRVLRYDRRGFGGTGITMDAYSHDGDLAALLSELDIGRATLVGCSQGAKIALDFALTRPGLVASLVLVSPAVSGYRYRAEPPPQTEELEKADDAGDVERVNELELQIWVDGPHRGPGEVDAAVRELVEDMNLKALVLSAATSGEQPPYVGAAERLGEIRVPVLVVAGDLDTPRTLEAAGFLAAGIEGARLEVVKGAAHLPNMERPEEFNRLVLGFLRDSGAGAAAEV
jgi:pimeloyl-ACP methyl ester carboxylesterase